MLLIYFRVGKQIAPTDPAPQDLNLNANLYVLWGVRMPDSTPGMIPIHAGSIPAVSQALVNPAGAVVATPVSSMIN